MKILVKIGYIICSICYIVYIIYPNPHFPDPPKGSIQSVEPADVEDLNRRGYYTNLTREEIIKYYRKEFAINFFGVKFTGLRLNYPPEEAQTLIRDQTRSTYLEELTHPLRESLYVNGFEPKEDKDMIIVEDKKWGQKIIVRYVESDLLSRITIALLTIAVIPLIYKMTVYTLRSTYKIIKRLWI